MLQLVGTISIHDKLRFFISILAIKNVEGNVEGKTGCNKVSGYHGTIYRHQVSLQPRPCEILQTKYEAMSLNVSLTLVHVGTLNQHMVICTGMYLRAPSCPC